MADQPVPRNEFVAVVDGLRQADQYNLARLDGHIADYRREAAEMKSNVTSIDTKLDQVLENQQRIKGRDGVILAVVMAVVSILCTVIAASILGVIR